ncbi:MAG: oxygen-independent coproporphyrinogen III oxidase, partial [Caulobacterales bacterium]|nr:oxygen-independent coproporphyrinogen III oxidase [Caulobacterales bacterium]
FMETKLAKIAELTAPRYTSYPTAPMFRPDIDGEAFKTWLLGLDENASLSLYFHVPYCKSICLYCGCHTFATRKTEPVLEYADTLIEEIELVAKYTKARKIKSIAWGGGTPNMLSGETFLKITDAINKNFDLSNIEEHAVEIDPRLLNDGHLKAFIAAGVNRASFGVQDLNDHVQRAIGRVQPYEQVEKAVNKLRNAGIEAINIDLIYGLPHQSVDDAINSAKLSAKLNPSRLAVFGYAHVPWFKKRQRLIDETALPQTNIRYDQLLGIKEALENEGYVAIGFDHYAKPDDSLTKAKIEKTLKRSFQGYTSENADALIGMGCSSISTMPQGYAQNNPEPGAWARAIEAGEFAIVRGVSTNDIDVKRRDLLDRLLCDFEIDLSQYGGKECFAHNLAPFQNLVDEGIAKIDGDIIGATEIGKPFIRLIAQYFDEYLSQSGGKHSRVI